MLEGELYFLGYQEKYKTLYKKEMVLWFHKHIVVRLIFLLMFSFTGFDGEALLI